MVDNRGQKGSVVDLINSNDVVYTALKGYGALPSHVVHWAPKTGWSDLVGQPRQQIIFAVFDTGIPVVHVVDN